MPQTQETPDTIHLDNGRTIKVATANPDLRVRIHGRNIRVGDIPLTAAKLGCGHIIRGIAFQQNDLIFCNEHGTEPLQTAVAEVY